MSPSVTVEVSGENVRFANVRGATGDAKIGLLIDLRFQIGPVAPLQPTDKL
ncbi:hypothetical protein [Corynebacterium sp. H113]|uniref:hypothetical protein n=1 Tax=Corynebacterium sp. H113 TaxID=3133419 RepID=UPI0030A3A0A0